MNGPFALALVAGMVATVNPCGFAMLPAYLSAFLGLEDRPGRFGAVGRALAISAVLTAGFITVFGLVGMVFGSALNQVVEHAPWFTIVLGFVLIAIGVYLVTGHELVVSTPKFERGGADGTLISMYLYGVSYAVASLGCALVPFVSVTSSAAADGSFWSRLVLFVLYGLGMGLVIAVLTVAVALARSGVVTRFRALLPKINIFAGVLMIISGAYVAYYGWYEIRLRTPGNEDDPVIDAAARIQIRLQELMPNTSNYGWYVVGAIVVIAAAVAWSARPRQDCVSDQGLQTDDRSHGVRVGDQ